FQPGIIHQRTPGRQASGGQSGRFSVRPTRRGKGKGACRGGYRLAGIAVNAIPGYASETFHVRAAVEPIGEEGADHGVANLEFRYARAHGGNFTGAIGHGDALFRRTPDTAHHNVVVVVQRVGMKTNADFTSSWGSVLTGADNHLVETTAG